MSLEMRETRSNPARVVAYGSLDLISHRLVYFHFSKVHTRSKVNSGVVVKSFCHLQESADYDFRKQFFQTPWGGSVLVQSEVTDAHAHLHRIMACLCCDFSAAGLPHPSHMREGHYF